MDLLARPAVVRGYRLLGLRYIPLAVDERGRLWLDPLRVWLALEGWGVVCYDERGERTEDLPAQQIARREAEGRLAEAEARAAELAARLQAAEEEFRRLRGDG